tara:strand:+ start:748 stop:966 length:219 start_codon:yes stop_codon:yes gene_type:complete
MVGVDIKFKLGETVFLRTDTEQLKRIITEIQISGNSMNRSVAMYELSQSENISKHYESEISKEKDLNINLGL